MTSHLIIIIFTFASASEGEGGPLFHYPLASTAEKCMFLVSVISLTHQSYINNEEEEEVDDVIWINESVDLIFSGFGEASPEAKGAAQLHKFFTYIAVRIVSAQLEVPSFLPSLILIPYMYMICDGMNPRATIQRRMRS